MTPAKLLTGIFLLFIACNYRSGAPKEMRTYSAHGLSLNLPVYWKVTKDEIIDTTAHIRMISVSDEEPLNKGAYLVITEIDKELDLKNILLRQLRSTNAAMNREKIPFGIVKESEIVKIGKLDALRGTFESPAIGNRSEGTLTVFYLNGKTYSFLFSTSVKDSKENKAMVDTIIKSLKPL
jgi:hypothetical protein